MSTTIDSKVVEMRFDNSHFEKHTRESMSTLDKLKEKLNFKDSSKGLEQLNTSANRVNMSGMSSALDTVHAKFSALQVMGVTALARITNSAITAGKRMVSALTIDPVKTGLKEYETQINSVQTIMANVGHKGKTLEDVNNALEELNTYADQTIYNFTEMTKNIGLFTNAGVGLDESVAAIKGFSNAAAMAGTDATRTAGAMYQLSQAMSSGKVLLRDWMSLEQANITGERFRETLMMTARVHGIAIDKMIKEEGSLRDTLSKGWLTSDLMAEVLDHYTLSTENMTEAEIEANKVRLRSIGYTEEQIEKLFALGTEATSAATKVKTFSQLWGVLVESAQSGWAKTWQLIIGDFEEAKSLLTPLADFLTNVIGKMSNARNKLLEGALSNPFTAMMEKLENSNIGKVAKKVNSISKSLEEYQNVVNQVWRGDFNNRGDNPDRYDLLEKAGWNPRTVQTLVNLGYKHKLTTEEVTAAEKKYGVVVEENAKTVEKLSDAQLENAGLTKEEIKLYRELEKQSADTGKSIDEIVKSMEAKDGRTLFIESFKNAGKGLVSVLNAIKEAWTNAFPPMSSLQLYNIIAAINKFSQKLVMSEDTSKKLTRTLKGLFAIVDLISMVLGGGLRIALFVVKSVLGAFNMDILSFTAYVGDAVVKVRDWIEEHNYLGMAIEKVTKFITKIVNAIKNWIDNNETIQNGLSKFKEEIKGLGGGLETWLKGLKEAENVPLYIIKGLINGLTKGAGSVIDVIISIGKGLIEGICEVLGIHSPSKEFEEVGGNIVDGLFNGIKNNFPKVFDIAKRIGSKLLSLFEEIDLGDILIAGGIFGILSAVKGTVKIVDRLTQPLAGVNNILNNVAGVVASARTMLDNLGGMFKDVGKGFKMKAIASVIKSLAFVILSLVGAVYVLSKLEPGKLWSAIGAIAVLTLLVGALYVVIEKVGQGDKKFKSSIQSMLILNNITGAIFKLALSTMMLALLPIGKMWSAVGAIAVLSLIAAGLYVLIEETDSKPTSIKSSIKSILALSAIANALFMMALAVRILATADPLRLLSAIAGFTYMVTAMGLLLVAFSSICKDQTKASDMLKLAGMLLAMSTSLLILTVVTKLVAGLSLTDLGKGALFMLGFVGFVKLLLMAIKVGKEDNFVKISGMLMAMSISMLLMIAVIKLVSLLEIGELLKGAAFMLGFIGFVKLLVSVLSIGNDETIAKVGATILAISTAMLLLTAVIKIIGGMDLGALIKGAIGIGYLTGIIALLVYIVESATDAPKIAGVLLALSGAIGILALSAKLLSTISLTGLVKGIGAITLLGIIVMTMIEAASELKGGIGSLVVMTVAIAVMALAVAGLSAIKFEKLAGATVGLSILMGMFALMTKASKGASKALGTLVVLTVLVAVLAGVIVALSKIPVESSMGSAAALSLLLAAITGVSVLLSKTGGLNAKALLGLLGLVALCGMLYIVVDVLKRMSGIQNAAESATVLGAFMGVLSVILLLTAATGAIYSATAGLAATGLLGMLALILMIYPILGALALMSLIPDAITNLTALQSFLITMTAILVVLAIVGPLALVGVTAMYALTTLMIVIGTLAVAIGALMEKFPALQSFLNTGLQVLIQLAGGIGQMIGAFVSGIFTQIASGLPFIGAMLSQFMINLMPFIQGVKLIDDSMIASVGSLAAAILILTAADLIAGVASFMSGGTSLAELGTELSDFMVNAMPFVAAAGLINPKMMEGVKTLAEAILILTGAELVQGLTSWVSGKSSLSEFGKQLPGLAEDLNNFATSLSGFGEAQMLTIMYAGNAIKALAEAAKEIPNDGGLWGTLCGENSLATFGYALPGLGTNLNAFLTNLGTFTEDQVTTADCVGRAIKALAEAANEIPNDGGLWGMIVGDNGLASFGYALPGLGTNMAAFLKNLGTFTEDQVTTVDCVGRAITTLAEAASEIPNEGGLWAAIVGDNSLATFAENLPGLGTHLKEFVKNLGTFSDDQISTVDSACKAIKAIAKLGNIDINDTGDGLKSFGKNMVDFAKKVGSFVTHMDEAGGENITSSIEKTNELIEMAQTVADTKTGSLKTFGESLKKFAKDGVSGFVKEFNGKTPKADAKAAGEDLAESVKSGIEAKKSVVKDEAKKVSEKAVDNFCTKTLKADAKTAGQDLATGFANGIKSDKSLTNVKNAGNEIGKAALKAAKKAIKSNSPSKEAMKIGNYFGQGLVIGINDYQTKSYDAGYGVAEYARKGLSKAVSRISDLVSGEIDAQPTIRPVLDLSDVESGANHLNTLFSKSPIGVNANLNAISSGMNNRIQNGTNGDVVSAINKLRKDLGNVGGDTYNINGVTYGNADNDINNAVQTLIRAANVERRI